MEKIFLLLILLTTSIRADEISGKEKVQLFDAFTSIAAGLALE
jgi:hypothetical protein